MPHRTISLLIESSATLAKPIAASRDREKLIHHAEALHLNRSMATLREPGARARITDLMELEIREVKLLDDE